MIKRTALTILVAFAFPATADAHHRHHPHHAHHAVHRLLPPVGTERATPAEEAELDAGDQEWLAAEEASPTHQVILPATPR